MTRPSCQLSSELTTCHGSDPLPPVLALIHVSIICHAMATLTEHNLSILTDWLTHKPQIIQATRGSPDYQRFRPTYVIDDAVNPPLIVRPPSAADVAGLVALMTTHSVPFTIRGGGHDLFHRCMANDAVVVDLRDIAHVHVNPESQSARIGGGVLVREVAAQLAKENLATACSVIPTVGYVGWAIHGGYGLLSSLYGLGADQILGAKVVNASGELIEADDLLLKGLRGAGGTLGVVVELTIRVYPLEKVRPLDIFQALLTLVPGTGIRGCGFISV